MANRVELVKRVLGRDVTVEVQLLGADIHVLVYGGDAAHLGGTAVAVPYLSAGKRPSAFLSSVSVPGHKDEELWRVIAKKVAVEHQATAIVSGGVHFEGVDAEDVAQASAAIEDLALRAARACASNAGL